MQRLAVRFTLSALLAAAMTATAVAQEKHIQLGGDFGTPLSRVREGGTPQQAPDAPLHPYAISIPKPAFAPTSGVRTTVPEYGPVRGVLYSSVNGQWNSVVTKMVAELTKPGYNEIAYVVVSAGQQANAANNFTNAGADMSKVVFINANMNALWIRDYGPHFIHHGGALAVVDSHYYPTRPLDNFIPNIVGEDFLKVPTYHQGLYYSGGNFQASVDLGAGNGREGYVTALINLDNPASAGFNAALIAEQYEIYSGIDTLHVLPQLPFSVDGTGHIDMWFYLIDEDSVIISEFKPGSAAQAITVTNNAVPYMQALGYTVTRTPAWNANGTTGTHYTYANAYRVNNRIFVPVYGSNYESGGNVNFNADDVTALAAWQAAAPGVEIVPIQCNSIIPASGAIHCIVKQIPAHTSAVPSCQIVWPDGGEMLKAGNTYAIRWAAEDDLAVTGIDLYYSTDGGATYPHTIALNEVNDSHYNWTVPNTPSNQVRVRVVARDGNGNATSSDSPTDLIITDLPQTVYTFANGAGVDKVAKGFQTLAWTNVNANRTPIASDIETLVAGAYGKIATSNTTSTSQSDVNRYNSPTVSANNECTHTYEFNLGESAADIRDIEILWEGFAAQCTQNELYVWNQALGNWGDANGLVGQNRYLDNAATNRDAVLIGNLRGNFADYLTIDNKLTLLVYSERPLDEQYTDFVRVSVIYDDGGTPCPEDCTGDGERDQADLALLLSCYNSGDCCDVTGDGITDQADLAALLAAYGVPCP